MPSAPDIITYVGVPLAVIGVLPILWVVLRSLSNYKRIKRSYASNGVAALVRWSLLSEQVEVEIGRHRLRPRTPKVLEMKEKQSTLKGGSWTHITWETSLIGFQTYHLRLEDDLTQPQAEVEFELLLEHLLGFGATVKKEGFQRLKNAGLWTSVGTELLSWPCSADKPATEVAVLTVSSQEDSEGKLSLALNWNQQWNGVSRKASMPYTVQLQPTWAPAINSTNELVSEKRVEADADAVSSAKGGREDLVLGEALCLKVDSSGLVEVIGEDDCFQKTEIPNMRAIRLESIVATHWVAAAVTALNCHKNEVSLWSFKIPSTILEDATCNTISAGVLVLAGIIQNEDVPPWRTKAPPSSSYQNMAHLQQFRHNISASDASAADLQKQNMQRLREQQDEARKMMFEREQQQRQDELDALHSEKLSSSRVAQACLIFLAKHNKIESGLDLCKMVEGLLFVMVHDIKMMKEVTDVLQRWSAWGRGANMSLEELSLLKKDQWDRYNEKHTPFAYAACIVALIAEAATKMAESPASDIQACLSLFRTVRLG